MLTEKCKTDFENWYDKVINISFNAIYIKYFYEISESMQYGVYVDFFDSETKFYIDIYQVGKQYAFDIGKDGVLIYNTLNEARTEAIKQANKIYNENST